MLYIIGTPIGNLEDLSYRQAKYLSLAEIILTEDTRSTGMLLQRSEQLFSFKRVPDQRLFSYYKENEFEKLPQIIEWLQEEKELVLISQAGMPLISDPGYFLVKTIIKQSIPFIVIPGPTAATTALIYSGFNPQEHMFLGFLPKKHSDILKVFEKIKQIKMVFPDISFIFYESPLRIKETLKLLDVSMPTSHICICRELTKKFEEILRGTPNQLIEKTYKGELTVVLS